VSMEPIAFVLQLEGEAVELDGGRYWVETRTSPEAGIGTEQAVCRRQLELWDDGSLVESGEIAFGTEDGVTFRARGVLGASFDSYGRHGTAILEVTGGRGRFARARGYVTSNFLLADTGELSDYHLGLLLLEPSGKEAR
jgi:hypothetical protein